MAPSGPKADPKKAAAPDPKAAAAKAAAAKKKAEKKEDDGKPKVEAPNRATYDEKYEKIQREIDNFQKQQGELSAKISERSGGKEEFFAQKAEISAQLDEVFAKLTELQAQKSELLGGVQEKVAEGREMRAQLNKMKKSIGYTSEGDIDDRIATIEFKLLTDTLSLKEEKKYMAEIQDLKRNRPKVNQVSQMEASLDTRDRGLGSKEKVNSINEEMARYREMKRQIAEKRSELMEGRKVQLGDMPQLISEREEIGKQIAEKIKERNGLRDEFRNAEREFYQYQQDLRREKQEKANDERQKKQAEYDQQRRIREAEKLDDQPFVAEMTLIEQTITYCKSLTSTKGGEEKEAKKEVVMDVPDGVELLVKKEDRDEYYWLPTAKGKKGKHKAAKGKEGGAKPIKHNAGTFQLFDKLKLDAPITTDDIPALLEKLDAQLDTYKEKVKVWEEKRDELKRKILEGEVIEEAAAAPEEEEAAEEEEKEEVAEEAEEEKEEAPEEKKEEVAEEAEEEKEDATED